MNKAGGMAVIWITNVTVLELITTAFTMEVHIMDTDTNLDQWFIGIYVSTDDQIRNNQWKIVEIRKELWGLRWIIAGDFNDITSNEEKWEGRRNIQGFQEFH